MARQLPIFPLPIVLFPGAPQPLHIFEPRYRQLLPDCLATDPQLLSFQVAAALELDPEAKRALQALRSTTARLRQLAALVGQLAADAERRAAVRQSARGNGRGGAHPQIEPAT